MPKNLNSHRATWRLVNNIPSDKTSSIKITNAATGIEFYIFDMIGLNDGEAQEFVSTVAQAKGKPINLFINSPGGFVFDAVAMYDSLITSGSQVSVTINGMAASAASFLSQAASPGKLKIAEPGRMMIHDAQGIGIGGPAEMQEYTDLLNSVSDDISRIYANRAGGEPKAWRKAMTATTWYNSEQAISNKLADSITTEKKKGPDNRTRLITARARVLTNMRGK
jgi:ATP-dependent protease ClpP protease subunit